MQLTASELYKYLRPSKCRRRIFLKSQGEEEAPPSPYEEVLLRIGERHEKERLATFPSYVDLSVLSTEEKAEQTREEVRKGTPVIYQPLLKGIMVFDNIQIELLGQPDFLLHDNENYIIQDSKISRRINEKDHPEILRQLELYGLLYEKVFGRQPKSLQVHSGTGEIVEVEYDGGSASLEILRDICSLKRAKSEPYSPVGWSKCDGCGFRDRCWQLAEKNRDIAAVYGVDQGLAITLHDNGIDSVDSFLDAFDEKNLAELKRQRGKGLARVGKSANSIFRMAHAKAKGEEFILQSPEIPDYPNYVMFDIEGLPPHLDDLEIVYLWGLQVFGDDPGKFQVATAGYGDDGDEQGWANFLSNAADVFQRYGDIPFIHWHHYERVHVDKYVTRFGDPDNVAARVKQNLVDLLPITKNSIALPLPSYSLKCIEQYIGFVRTQDEYGGDWAMAKYIEATEMEDEKQREEVLSQILIYNREDLEATWAVLKWLMSKDFG